MTDATQLSDFYMVDSALKTDHDIKVSRKKKLITVNDANNTDYSSGIVEFDASSITGSEGFSALKEGFLTVPYIITAKNTGSEAMGGIVNRFCCTLKTGVWNVIDSIEVHLNGKIILTHEQYKMHWANFRAQTETSVSDLEKHATDTNLFPDDWYSINYTNAASVNGDGYSNNGTNVSEELDQTLGQAQENRSLNSGLMSKLNNTFGVIDSSTNDTFGWPSLRKGAIQQITQQSGRGGFVEGSGSVAGMWVHILKIRLADLHPLFKELDLISGLAQLKLKVRFNTGTVAINVRKSVQEATIRNNASTVFATTANSVNTVQSIAPYSESTSMKLNSITLSSGKTCPILIASGADKQPMSKVGPTAADGQLSFSYGVLRNEFSVLADFGKYLPHNTVRLNVPSYDLIDPRPIISKPIKEVKYLDCSTHWYPNGAGSGTIDGQMNAQFDITLGPTYKNIKYVLVVPYPSDKDLFATAQNVQEFQSPFSSSPWTALAGASMTNFQCTIGTDTVFDKTLDYDYEHFMTEFSKISAINGDVDRSMNTGLIDFMKWTYAHHVLVADCSRVSKKDVPASVRVSFTNTCSQGISPLIIVVRERSLSIDRLTGEVERFD